LNELLLVFITRSQKRIKAAFIELSKDGIIDLFEYSGYKLLKTKDAEIIYNIHSQRLKTLVSLRIVFYAKFKKLKT